MAWPPFDDGYNGVLSPPVVPVLERWLVNQLRRLVLAAGGTWAQIARWPGGARGRTASATITTAC